MENRLKLLRKERGLLQRDVAEHLNIAVSTYSYWENGKFEPDQESLSKLADFFGVSADYLLGREKNSPPAQQESLNIPDALKPYQFAFYEGMDGLSEESIKDILKYVEFTREKEQKETKKK